MLDEYDEEREPLETMNVLKAIRFTIRAWSEVSAQTIANCWLHSNVNGSRGIQNQPCQQAQAEVEAILEQQMHQLLAQQRIQQRMDIRTLISPPEEVVEDSNDDIAEQIAQLFEPIPDQESDNEGVEELPRIAAQQALLHLRNLRLHEEQSDDCNSDWLRSLDRYEKVVKHRQQKGLQQSQLETFWTST